LQRRRFISLCGRLAPLGSPGWQTLHTRRSLRRGTQPHWRGNAGTQYESPVTAFLPAHSIEMENEEG